jgi:hypothetical protein
LTVYIPQNIDPYNTHLKNLVDAYTSRGIIIRTGFEMFLSAEIPDIIHFHFLEGLLKRIKYNEELFFEQLDFYKKNNVKFLLTVHDSKPHSNIKQIDFSRFYCKFIGYVDLFIHHGENSKSLMISNQPASETKKHIVCHHGDYLSDMKVFNYTQEESRRIMNLPLNKKIILIFGQLQFKNTSFAETVFQKIKPDIKDSILLMAGVYPIFRFNRLNRIYYRFNNKFLNLFHSDKIRLYNRFTQQETYLLFKASDVIFLPHSSGLTTGIIPMAATLSKPFVYPSIGVFEEQANFCLSEKYESNNLISASIALSKILSAGELSFDNEKWLLNNNWDRHVDAILANI